MNNNLEKIFNRFLQKEVTFYINSNKPLKTGKLLIFKFKDFYLNFLVKNGTSNKVYELPYPFSIVDHGNYVEMSYTLEDFSQKNLDILYKSKILTPKKKNKLFNSTVVLSANN